MRADITLDYRQPTQASLGTYGHLAIFGWVLGMIMLTSGYVVIVAGVLCLSVSALIYPNPFRRILRWRWLIWMLLLVVPTIFFLGEHDSLFAGVSYSSEGLTVGIQMAVRFIVLIIGLQNLTRAVDISSMAGLLERFGLHGLGFAVGVALNLLPALETSAVQAWYTLKMRGGLRRQRWRGCQLLVMTIITNALKRAEEVSLAAEMRAFSPEKSRPFPIEQGPLDRASIGLMLFTIVVLVLVQLL